MGKGILPVSNYISVQEERSRAGLVEPQRKRKADTGFALTGRSISRRARRAAKKRGKKNRPDFNFKCDDVLNERGL